jgi:hypothetical protein
VRRFKMIPQLLPHTIAVLSAMLIIQAWALPSHASEADIRNVTDDQTDYMPDLWRLLGSWTRTALTYVVHLRHYWAMALTRVGILMDNGFWKLVRTTTRCVRWISEVKLWSKSQRPLH